MTPQTTQIQKAIIFDAGTLISFSMNGATDIIRDLKGIFKGKFLITKEVMNEIIDKPIRIKKDQLWKYSTFLLLAVMVVVGFIAFTGNGGSPTGEVVGAPTAVPIAPSQQPSVVSASADDDPFLGDENAPVTLIEFSDYQCPFCGRFWSQTLDQIKIDYIDTGKVKFVYRDFPLDSIHPLATPAAEAAECVRDAAGGSDEAYFEYHDKIFTNQASLSNENLKVWAQELGYNIDNCLSSGKFTAEVRKDLADATASGGRGTPYFVIIGSNGQGTPLSGAQPYSAFKQILDAS